MFPHLHIVEVKQFLSIADGDCEKAVQLILQKEESGLVLNKPLISKSNVPHVLNSKEKLVEDKQLREQILKRYAYIDQDDDVREHKPVAPKTEPKKLIRYRDNKIVSIKGERYSEIKKSEGEGDPK
ncbi:CUE domain-containing protein 2-B [Araneus ventricosus]|uniref:CUE domain-containing protein 2-B n=2 Tax=Araneidae TaxID=6913 RepID=A0A4Y2A123_ARAVE|nr:CUE domain-containing protein 2-B [Araneus ventricosus]